MSGSVLVCEGSILAGIEREEDQVTLVFELVYLLKSQGIPAVDASTRWRQSGELVLGEANLGEEVPALPATITGGRIQLNQYTYVEMFPLPLEDRGLVRLRLDLRDTPRPLEIEAEKVKFTETSLAKYIEHVS